MEKLIRKILREEFFTENIEISELPYSLLKKYFLLGEAKATAPIFKEDEDYINDRINKEKGDKSYFEVGNLKFDIEPTTHWLQRLNRKMEPEYENVSSVYDPTLDDGLDVLYKTLKNKLGDFIRNNDWNKNKNPCYEIIFTNSVSPMGKKVDFSMIVNVFPIAKKTYRIRLVTQIKGERLYSDKYSCTRVKLDENRKRMKKLFPSFFELTVV